MLETLFLTNFITGIFGFAISISKASTKLFFGISIPLILFQSIIIGMRDPFMMTDTREYVGLFMETTSFADRIEPFFMILTKGVRVFTSDPQIFLITFAIAINFVYFYFLYIVLGSRALIVFALFGATHIYWLSHVQTMRNSFASAFLLLGLSYFVVNRRKRGWIFSAIAINLHYSTIGPILAMLMAFNIRNMSLRSIFTMIVIGGTAIAAFLMILPSIPAFTPWFQRVEAYSYYAANDFQESSLGIQYLFFIIIFSGYFLTWRKQEEFSRKLFWGYFSIVILSFILWSNILYRDRILLFAQMLEPVLIYLLITTFVGNKVGAALLMVFIFLYSGLIIFYWGPNSVLNF